MIFLGWAWRGKTASLFVPSYLRSPTIFFTNSHIWNSGLQDFSGDCGKKRPTKFSAWSKIKFRNLNPKFHKDWANGKAREMGPRKIPEKKSKILPPSSAL